MPDGVCHEYAMGNRLHRNRLVQTRQLKYILKNILTTYHKNSHSRGVYNFKLQMTVTNLFLNSYRFLKIDSVYIVPQTTKSGASELKLTAVTIETSGGKMSTEEDPELRDLIVKCLESNGVLGKIRVSLHYFQ